MKLDALNHFMVRDCQRLFVNRGGRQMFVPQKPSDSAEWTPVHKQVDREGVSKRCGGNPMGGEIDSVREPMDVTIKGLWCDCKQPLCCSEMAAAEVCLQAILSPLIYQGHASLPA